MKILALESSCDETAAAVVRNGRQVLSSVVNSQIEIHKEYGGVVPEIASRNHVRNIDCVVKAALDEAGVTPFDLDGIAVTYGAGLVGALLVGVSFAKSLSQATGVPLIKVNHIEGHICANYITHPELEPPFVCLLASGGHTAVVMVESYTDYSVLKTTIDDACGEAFDKVARTLGLPYPGGVWVDKLAREGKNTADFKSAVMKDGNFSYSGLKTGVINCIIIPFCPCLDKEIALNITQTISNFGIPVIQIKLCFSLRLCHFLIYPLSAERTFFYIFQLVDPVSAF